MIKFYRYEAKYTASMDEFDNFSRSLPTLELTEFNLIKETPKSYRIAYEWDQDARHTKVMRKNARKKFACLTKEDAAKSFLLRKRRQVNILSERLNCAKMELNLAKQLNNESL
jgi:hypothetical protein